ncbi:MAG: 50S ribosomal protein L5 [Mycoplasmataceae bacterium]|nr:50S ribosomal protein L5 [Mycoplasmataceae bacterium]
MIKNSEIYNKYENEIKNNLKVKFNHSSIMQSAKIEKVVINIGLGKRAIADKNIINEAVSDIEKITGQKPIITKAKKSIAGFKLREGMPIGVKVTLRGQYMYDFLEKLINVSIPRIRDFRGLSNKSFDKSGNYTFGIKELIVFPEIEFDKVKFMKGCDITIVTSTNDNEEAKELLYQIGMPLKK